MAYRNSTVQQSFSPGLVNMVGNLPAGTADGDVLLALVVQDAFAANFTPPLGWSSVVDISQSAPDGCKAVVYKKTASSEPSTWNWVTDQTNSNATVIVGAWSGRNTSGSLVTHTTSNTTANATPISCTDTGLTALAGDDLVFFIELDYANGASVWSFTASPGSMTERQDNNNAGFITVGMFSQDNVSAGATGSLTATATRSSGSGGSGYGIALISIPQAAAGVNVAWFKA